MRERTSFHDLVSPRNLNRECFIRRPGLSFALTLFLLACFPACRQAAFNEYYVESMASEIRALEDRIYEYDSAYQSLELENDDLRAKHERLTKKLRELEEENELELGRKPSRPSPREPKSAPPAKESDSFELVPPPKTKTEEPAPIVPRSSSPAPVEPKSELPGTLPKVTPPALKDSGESILPTFKESESLPPPNAGGTSSTPARSRQSVDIKATELVEEYTVPSTLIRSAQQPSAPNLLTHPAVDHLRSNPSSKPLPIPGTTPGAIIQGRIQTPTAGQVVQASAAEPILSGDSIARDRRVVGIDFHPTLCRGINLDQTPGDDGLYLVVTPRNLAGQIVNESGNITIVAEETVDDQSRRISSWEIDSLEMQEYLEPVGASQGYHLRLPWQENEPIGRTIQVFVKCEFDDGRKLVNRREITLSKSGIRPLTWTPRQ